jgi:hypothetical protein
MKKILVLVIIIQNLFVTAQQLEFGLNLGYNFSNIVDSNSDTDRAVIGNALWNSNLGFNILCYFKDPDENVTTRLNAIYRISKKGSVSEINANNKFEFSSKTHGLTFGMGGNVGDGYILFLDAGFGYSLLDNNDIYTGNLAKNQAFIAITDDFLIKNNEFVFLYALGVEKEIYKSLKLTFEVNGDASITKLNKSQGSFRTQGVGFSLGIRYILKLKNKGL